MTPLKRITERVSRHGDVNDQATIRSLLTLAEFFDGNNSIGSIGCNLIPTPEPAEFAALLGRLAARPDVVEIRMFDDPEGWSFSDTVWITTLARPDEVADWFDAWLRPDACSRGRTPDVRFEACPVPPGMHPVACWWD